MKNPVVLTEICPYTLIKMKPFQSTACPLFAAVITAGCINAKKYKALNRQTQLSITPRLDQGQVC